MKSVLSMRLSDLTEQKRPITYGVVKPGPEQNDGVLFVRGGDIFAGRIALDVLRTITPEVSAQYKRTLIRGGELLISLVGNPGEVAIAPESLAGANIARQVGLIALRPEINTQYVMYYLMSPQGRAGLFAQTGGAVQQVINLADLKRVVMPLPSRFYQNRVTNILSSYDDLIDTNRRRILLLEESARLLFREWFVYFKFPNHEKVKIVDRGGRKMPAEWEYLPFTKIKLFKKAPLGVPVFTNIRQYCQTSEIDGTSITGNGEEVDYENRPSRADIAPRINTIYFAKMKDTDKVLYFNKGNSDLLEKILLSTGMVGFTTDEKYLGFLFGLLTSYEFVQYKNNFATGATQVSLNDASLKKIKVLFPVLNLVELYSEVVNRLLEECSYLRSQNQKLAQARDLLLPRLMSGAIEV
ncbi:MAG: restriction endonuclease subunit S [Pseudomonadota bacterium]